MKLEPTDSIHSLTSKGWKVIADGPSGVQLQAPKKMRVLDTLWLVAGIVVMFLGSAIFGTIMVGAALLDFALFTKPETKFIPRFTP